MSSAIACGEDEARAPGHSDGGAGGRGSGGRGTGGARPSGGTTGGGTTGGGTGGQATAGAGGVPEGGAGTREEWEGCPEASTYPGEAAWPHRLTVTDTAVYCAAFNEERTLTEELSAKAMLRIAPGAYPLPAEALTGVALPLCFRFRQGQAPVSVTSGDVDYNASPPQFSYMFKQPVEAPAGQRLFSATLMDREESGAPRFALDGSETDFHQQDAIYYFSLCPEDGCAPYYGFDSCTHAATGRPEQHRVTLNGGEITFELNITPSLSSTEPASFVRARGTFRGIEFDQRSYWKLVYSPAHHHFVRDFAVLFDAPIEGACGVTVQGLEPGTGNLEPDVAAAVDCELGEVEALEVRSHEHLRR